MHGANTTIRVALTAAALVAGMLIAVIPALEYADAERDRELRQWQVRLGLIADTRTDAVELWLQNQFGAERDPSFFLGQPTVLWFFRDSTAPG